VTKYSNPHLLITGIRQDANDGYIQEYIIDKAANVVSDGVADYVEVGEDSVK
jgi:hypothetical protein